MKVTILTITKRLGGMDVLFDRLRNQTALPGLIATNDVEYIYVDEYARDPERREAFSRMCDALGIQNYKHVYPNDYDPPRWGKLCRANNTGLNLAQGEFIFFLNDYMWMQDDTLEKFLDAVSRVDFPLLITTPNDRTNYPPKTEMSMFGPYHYTIFKKGFGEMNLGFPNVECYTTDSRKMDSRELPFHRNPIEWEACVAMAPTALLRAAGGWDESLDYGYAQDNIDVAVRVLAYDPRARIHFMKDIRTISIQHTTYFDDPPDMLEACDRNMKIVTPRIPPEVYGLKRDVRPEPELQSGYEIRPKVYDIPKDTVITYIPSSKMSVCFWMPDIGSWNEINPSQPFANALGGRETACVRLAQELSKLGCTVGIVTPCTSNMTSVDGVSWVHPNTMKKGDIKKLSDFDVVVSMERPDIFQKVRAKLNIVHFQCTYPPTPIGELDRKIDHYILLSKYQQFTLRTVEPSIDGMKCVTLGNGIDLDRYDSVNVPTIPGRMVWSSSPDRGLYHLLRWWPILKAKMPDISLRIFYDIEKSLGPWRWTMQLQAEWFYQCKDGILQDGIEYLGPVDQKTLAKEQKRAELFVYPCDPSAPTETFCITALENMAAGVPVLMSTADCLPEVYGGQRDAAWFVDVPVMDARWIEAITTLRGAPDELRKNVARGRALAEQYTWERLAARWFSFLSKRIALDNPDEINDLIENEEKELVLSEAVAS